MKILKPTIILTIIATVFFFYSCSDDDDNLIANITLTEGVNGDIG
jgi:hypothetical protein